MARWWDSPASARRSVWRLSAAALLLCAAAASAGCGGAASGSSGGSPAQSSAAEQQLAPNQVKVTKAELGEDWPFTVDEGVITGDGSGGVGVVTFTAGDVTYAVNGTAVGTHKYAPIDAIWADNPSVPGLNADYAEVAHPFHSKSNTVTAEAERVGAKRRACA